MQLTYVTELKHLATNVSIKNFIYPGNMSETAGYLSYRGYSGFKLERMDTFIESDPEYLKWKKLIKAPEPSHQNY